MAAVEIKVGVELIDYLQSSFFQAGKCAAAGQQFRFKRAPARFGLGVIVRVAWSAIAGQCLDFFDARVAN